jgi:hypothetical protein
MLRRTIPLVAFLLTAIGACELAAQAPDPFAASIRPILEARCNSCHSGGEPKGGLDLARFKIQAEAVTEPEVWERVSERINLVEMPPEGSPGLSDEQRGALFGWLAANRPEDKECSQLATDSTQGYYSGHVMSRRLTRDEYNNTIRDLVGIDLRPADRFPSDGSGGEGFDNVGDTLYSSTVLVEKYLAAAKGVLDVVFSNSKNGGASAGAVAEAREKILVAEPSDHLTPRQAAGEIVAAFARRAFRRPVTPQEVERLLTMFDRGYQRGDGFEPSVKLALEAVLISPNFLFLPEPTPETEGVQRLGNYELATRLAYFLWASMPDDELLALAGEQKLQDDGVLRQQVRRMLADPKAHGFAESFATQWLGIGALGGTTKPDPERFPQFDDQLAADMRSEAVAFVGTVLRKDRSLLDLLDCDYAMLNARLAKYYRLPPVEGVELREVKLDDRRRGGVTGLGAVLTVTSLPLRTSPVLRGKWVLDEVLGSPVPPPPPTVPTLPKDDRIHDGLTFRQRLDIHRTNPECAACHARMDPLGFGLECFDATGRWRHHLNGQPVDASGQLPSGEAFIGPAELKQVLLARKQEFITNLTRKLLGYALGRGLTKFDDCVVKSAVTAIEANDYRSTVLIEHIALSFPFQHRYYKK